MRFDETYVHGLEQALTAARAEVVSLKCALAAKENECYAIADDDIDALRAQHQQELQSARAEVEWHKGRYDRTVVLYDEMAVRVATLAQELTAARAERDQWRDAANLNLQDRDAARAEAKRLSGERHAVYRIVTEDAQGVGASPLQAAEWLRDRARQFEDERDAARAEVAALEEEVKGQEANAERIRENSFGWQVAAEQAEAERDEARATVEWQARRLDGHDACDLADALALAAKEA